MAPPTRPPLAAEPSANSFAAVTVPWPVVVMAWAKDAMDTIKSSPAPTFIPIPRLSSLNNIHKLKDAAIKGRKYPPRPKRPFKNPDIVSPAIPILSVKRLTRATIHKARAIRHTASSFAAADFLAFEFLEDFEERDFDDFVLFEVLLPDDFEVFLAPVAFVPLLFEEEVFLAVEEVLFFCAIVSPHKNPSGLHN